MDHLKDAAGNEMAAEAPGTGTAAKSPGAGKTAEGPAARKKAKAPASRAAAKTPEPQKPANTPGIEETFEALEEMVKKLEDGGNTLEESFACYEQGIKLVKSLNDQIDKVEKQILILSEGEEDE